MPADRRTEQEIRREISVEREQLVGAIADLRAGISAKRRSAAVVSAMVAAGLAARAALEVARRRRR